MSLAGKAAAITSVKALIDSLKVYNGSGGQSQQDAIDKFSEDLIDIIDVLVRTAVVATTGAGTGTGAYKNGTLTVGGVAAINAGGGPPTTDVSTTTASSGGLT